MFLVVLRRVSGVCVFMGDGIPMLIKVFLLEQHLAAQRAAIVIRTLRLDHIGNTVVAKYVIAGKLYCTWAW
jgi:hypothetical protein